MMQIDNEAQNQVADQTKQLEPNQTWTQFVDGSSTRDGYRVGIVLKSLEGTIIE